MAAALLRNVQFENEQLYLRYITIIKLNFKKIISIKYKSIIKILLSLIIVCWDIVGSAQTPPWYLRDVYNHGPLRVNKVLTTHISRLWQAELYNGIYSYNIKFSFEYYNKSLIYVLD